MTVLLIILGILAALILLIVVLLHFSVKAYILADKNHAYIEVKYLGFRFYKLNVPYNTHENSNHAKKDEDQPVIILTELDEDNSEDKPDGESTPEEPKPEADSAAQEITKEPESDKPESVAEDIKKGSDKKDEKKDVKEKDKEPKPSLIEQFNEYKKYIPAGKKAFRKLLKLIRFYGLKFSLTVGDDDPYKAGLNFGRINAAVYSLLGLICCIFSVKIDSTEIKCDFERKTADFSFETWVYVRPSAVIALAAYIGIYYLKVRKSMKKLDKMAKEKSNNEREKH